MVDLGGGVYKCVDARSTNTAERLDCMVALRWSKGVLSSLSVFSVASLALRLRLDVDVLLVVLAAAAKGADEVFIERAAEARLDTARGVGFHGLGSRRPGTIDLRQGVACFLDATDDGLMLSFAEAAALVDLVSFLAMRRAGTLSS